MSRKQSDANDPRHSQLVEPLRSAVIAHEGGDLEGFLQAEVTRYRPQLQKYRSIYSAYADAEVRCALYFPLLQAFVEVDA